MYKLVLIALILSLSYILFPITAFSQISCGDTITEDTTLTEDLVCPIDVSHAIIIGASDITLDLGGHTLLGQTIKANDTTAILAQNVKDITITNGTIDGFSDAIFIIDSTNAIIRDMVIRNENINDPDHYISGVHLQNTHNSTIMDSQFEYLFTYHKDAVTLYSSDAIIKNIHSRGGTVGLSYYPVCDNTLWPNTFEVSNSVFTDVPIGIEIMCSSQARITDNKFINSNNAIQGDAPFPGAVTGLYIENNIIETSVSPAIGIEFRGIQDSEILSNTITGNDAYGIILSQSLGCISEISGWECFYSKGNTITENIVRDNGTDLVHDSNSTPNIWKNNIFDTKEGADIKNIKSSITPILELLLN